MDAASTLGAVRRTARLTQDELAARAGTSQATVSAYETGRKQPSFATLNRLLAAAGVRLSIEPAERPVVHITEEQLARTARSLLDVLDLAEALPTEHDRRLRYPPLSGRVIENP